MKVTSSGEFVSPRRHRSFIYNLTTVPPSIATCRDRTQKKQLMSSPSGVLGLTAEQGDDYGYGEPVPLMTSYRRLDPKEHPHPLNNPDISYGMYNSGVPQSRKCCIVENFSKTWVSSHSDFASHMQKNRFPNLCLEVYGYDEPNGKLICEPFKSTLMSWTEQLLESRNLDCWKDEDDIISGKSLLRPLFGFLMVYAPEGHYHPDLLNSVCITDENKVKFLSKVEVLRGRGACKNLSEVVSFIYVISTGVTPQNLKRIGNLKFPELLPEDLAHIPKGLWNLYKYLQSYEPHRHPACFFFDPPFLHGWPDRMHYVYHVHMEVFGYNPSIKKKFRNIINWDSWEKSLSEVNDVLKEYEDFRNSKIADGSSNMFYKPHGPNEGMIKYFVNIFKHLHSDLPHTQKARVSAVSSAYATNPTPVNALESIIEKRLNVSGYAYMALNEYLKTNPGEVKQFSERILTWPRLGL